MSDSVLNPNNDASADYALTVEQRKTAELDAYIASLRAKGTTGEAKPATPEPTAEPKKPTATQEAVGTVGTVLRNAQEIPRGGVVGATRALNETLATIDATANAVNEGLSKLGVDIPTIKFDQPIQIPQVMADPKTPTGQITADVAQFLTGFLPAMRATKAIGITNKVAQSAVAGAAADIITKDPYEENLSSLIQKYPALQNPVSEALAVRDDELKDRESITAWENRLRRGIEGAGVGLLTDGLVYAVGAIRAARKNKTSISEQFAKALSDEEVKYASTSQELKDRLGDPEGPLTRKASKKADDGSPVPVQTELDMSSEMGPGAVRDAAAEGRQLRQTGNTEYNFAAFTRPGAIDQVLKDSAEAYAERIDSARRGILPMEAQEALARKLGMSVEQLMARKQGEAFNAEQVMAATDLLTAATAKTIELARAAGALNAGPVDVYAFHQMRAIHEAVMASVLGARAESGRSLNAWKHIGQTTIEAGRMVDDTINSLGGLEQAKEAARRIAKLADMGELEGVDLFVRKGLARAGVDAIREVYTAGMLWLSGLANVGGNFVVAGMQIYERAVGSALGQLLRRDGPDMVQPGEAIAMAYGMVGSIGDALRAAAKALRTGEQDVALGGRKAAQDAANVEAISGKAFGADGTPIGKFLDVAGVVNRIPYRVLGAGDDFFKVFGYRMEVHAQALRQAVAEGGDQKTIQKRITELVNDPPDNIRMAAISNATYQTFTDKVGEFTQSLIRVRDVGGGFNPTYIPLTFLATPSRIMNYTFERTPFAPLVGKWREDIAAGGARADLAMARMSTGSAIMLWAMDMADNGYINGSEKVYPQGLREAMQREGQSFNAVKVGDTWYSFQKDSTVGMLLGLAATINAGLKRGEADPESMDDWYEAVAMGITAVSSQVLDRSWFRNLADLAEVMMEPGRYAEDYIGQVFSNLLPFGSLSRTAAKIADPSPRETMSPMDFMEAKIIGLSEKLTVKRDLWGDERKGNAPLGDLFDAVSPYKATEQVDSPIDREMQRLNMNVGRIHKKDSFSDGETSVDVNFRDFPNVYETYTKLAGNELKHVAWGKGAKDYLNDLVTGKAPLSDLYNMKQDGKNGGKADEIRALIGAYRSAAQREIMTGKQFDGIKEFEDFRKIVKTKGEETRKAKQLVPPGVQP